jgi:hypothetical protein
MHFLLHVVLNSPPISLTILITFGEDHKLWRFLPPAITAILLGLFYPEDGTGMFLRNVGWLSNAIHHYTTGVRTLNHTRGTHYETFSKPLSLHLSSVHIFSSAPCSQTASVYVQLSHPYRTTDKIIVPYILIFMFSDSRREDKRFWTEW